MFKVNILAVGKLKESFWREAEAEYLKRLSPYAKIKITELIDEPFHTTNDRMRTQEKEAEKIKKHLREAGVIIACHEQGKIFTSGQLASWLSTRTTHGEQITFILGGPLGLHQSILAQAHLQCSLSPLTFPHNLARIILLEQLYRAGTILAKKQYHY